MLEANNAERALGDFERAVSIRTRLMREDTKNLAMADDLAMAFDWLGKCTGKLDQSDRALACYTSAFDIRQDLRNAQPDVPKRALDVILSQVKIAVWHMGQRTEEGDSAALELLETAKNTLSGMKESGRLAGHERRYVASMKAIEENLALIAKRKM
jgi:tetratricopeptide (TPR) repeat protein